MGLGTGSTGMQPIGSDHSLGGGGSSGGPSMPGSAAGAPTAPGSGGLGSRLQLPLSGGLHSASAEGDLGGGRGRRPTDTGSAPDGPEIGPRSCPDRPRIWAGLRLEPVAGPIAEGGLARPLAAAVDGTDEFPTGRQPVTHSPIGALAGRADGPHPPSHTKTGPPSHLGARQAPSLARSLVRVHAGRHTSRRQLSPTSTPFRPQFDRKTRAQGDPKSAPSRTPD